jgi:hypothetical protein
MSNTQQPAQLHNAATVLHESGIGLPGAADDLMLCMQHADLWSAADRRQLLDILGQLVRQVLPCVAALCRRFAFCTCLSVA